MTCAWGNEVSGDGSIVNGPAWEPAALPLPQPPPEARQPALLEEEEER